MQVQPGQNIPIVRQLGLPDDAGTYYVQAVVRNSTTGIVLTTINLSDDGDQRFTGIYSVGGDPTGMGFWLDITTFVYTDSGYTTLSQLYQIATESYRVFDSYRLMGGIGGGGDYTNYDKIEGFLKKAVLEIVGNIKKEDSDEESDKEEKDVEFNNNVLSMIDGLGNTFKQAISESEEKLKTLVNKEVSKVTEVLNAVTKTLSELPRFQETNLSGVMDALTTLKDHLTEKIDRSDMAQEGMLVTAVQQVIDTIDEKVNGEKAAMQELATLKESVDGAVNRLKPVMRRTEKAEPIPSEIDMTPRARKLMGR